MSKDDKYFEDTKAEGKFTEEIIESDSKYSREPPKVDIISIDIEPSGNSAVITDPLEIRIKFELDRYDFLSIVAIFTFIL
jgi:hypothetical protein